MFLRTKINLFLVSVACSLILASAQLAAQNTFYEMGAGAGTNNGLANQQFDNNAQAAFPQQNVNPQAMNPNGMNTQVIDPNLMNPQVMTLSMAGQCSWMVGTVMPGKQMMVAIYSQTIRT